MRWYDVWIRTLSDAYLLRKWFVYNTIAWGRWKTPKYRYTTSIASTWAGSDNSSERDPGIGDWFRLIRSYDVCPAKQPHFVLIPNRNCSVNRYPGKEKTLTSPCPMIISHTHINFWFRALVELYAAHAELGSHKFPRVDSA